MKTLPLIAIAAAALPLAGCAAGERGLVSPHQPLVTASGATTPNCPDWSDRELPASEGLSSNFGCATAVNFAAMIADPRDLVRGRTDSTTGLDAATGVAAIKAWRETGTTAKQGRIEKQSAKGN